MTGHEFTTAELRDGETPDLTAHDLANERAKEELREWLNDEEVDDGGEE